MRYLKKNKYFLMLILLCFSGWLNAESINAVRSEGILRDNGQIAISSRFDINLSKQLEDILQQGVPLYFDLEYRLKRPKYVYYKLLFSSQESVQYKLSYHPLTNRYRVAVGTFSTEYPSLEVALKAIGAIVGWSVLPKGTLSGYKEEDIRMDIRLGLSNSQLPQPFQINILTEKQISLDSNWVRLEVSK